MYDEHHEHAPPMHFLPSKAVKKPNIATEVRKTCFAITNNKSTGTTNDPR